MAFILLLLLLMTVIVGVQKALSQAFHMNYLKPSKQTFVVGVMIIFLQREGGCRVYSLQRADSKQGQSDSRA